MATLPKLNEIIEKELERRIEIEVQRLLAEIPKKLQEKAPEIVASLAIDIMQVQEISSMMERITFNIRQV